MKWESLFGHFTLLFKNTGLFLHILFHLHLTNSSGSTVKQVTVEKNKNEYIHSLCLHIHGLREDKTCIWNWGDQNDKLCIKISHTSKWNRNSEWRGRRQRLWRENREQGNHFEYERKATLLNHGERIRGLEIEAEFLFSP